MKNHIKLRVWILFLLALSLLFSGCNLPANTPSLTLTPTTLQPTGQPNQPNQLVHPGEILFTHIYSPENGQIAVRVDLPSEPRYGESAPIVVVASTWFVEKYNQKMVPFHLEYNPVDVGAISVSHMWPGKTDPDSKIGSEGEYDYGGPNSLAALRDTIRSSRASKGVDQKTGNRKTPKTDSFSPSAKHKQAINNSLVAF